MRTALSQVSSRQVLLRAGYAYVPRDKLVSIIMGRFRTHVRCIARRRRCVRASRAGPHSPTRVRCVAQLNFCMVRAYKALPAILQDPRFAPRLTNLSKAYVGPGFGGQTGEKANGVTPENLNSVRDDPREPATPRVASAVAQPRAVPAPAPVRAHRTTVADTSCASRLVPPPQQLIKRGSAPLCMRHLHEKLVENHHLRHGGRMQYGLFLKGIGLSLEDALRFWQTEFTKVR